MISLQYAKTLSLILNQSFKKESLVDYTKRHSDYLHACNALHLTAVKDFIRVYDNQTQMTCSHSWEPSECSQNVFVPKMLTLNNLITCACTM